MFLRAAKHGELDMMRGVSSNVMCGQEGFFGTGICQVFLDINEMLKLNEAVAHEETSGDKITDMFGQINNPDDPCSIVNLALYNNTANIATEQLGEMDDDYDIGI